MYIKPEMELIQFLQDVITASDDPGFDVDYGKEPGDENPDDFLS